MAKISFFAFLFCFYFAYATEPEAFRSKIVGGTETAPNEFPWIVHLTAREPDGLPTNYAGSLITDRCILTGGFVLNRALVIDVTLGAHNISDTSEPYRLKERALEFYSYSETGDPPGILILPQPVTFSEYIQPIKLAYSEAQDDPFLGQTVVAIGWGRTTDLNIGESEVLRKVEVPIISNADCIQIFGGLLPENSCTSGTGRKGICFGDMGGPLNYYDVVDGTWSQVGINSGTSVIGCQLGFPSVYIRIRPVYKEWIESICGPLP